MTALTNTPQDTNYLQASKFILTLGRIPDVQFFCQEANVPSVTIGRTVLNTPLKDIYSPGTKLNYEEFNITFTVNEGATNWQEINKWFLAMGSPEGLEKRAELNNLDSKRKSGSKSFDDITLTIFSAMNNPIVRIKFINAFPLSLSGLNFDTKSSANDIITANVSFEYDYFIFEKA